MPAFEELCCLKTKRKKNPETAHLLWHFKRIVLWNKKRSEFKYSLVSLWAGILCNDTYIRIYLSLIWDEAFLVYDSWGKTLWRHASDPKLVVSEMPKQKYGLHFLTDEYICQTHLSSFIWRLRTHLPETKEVFVIVSKWKNLKCFNYRNVWNLFSPSHTMPTLPIPGMDYFRTSL